MQQFETKKSEKSPYTRSDAEEPPNFHAAGIRQPNSASAEDKTKKKSFATNITGSQIKLPAAARFCKPLRWYDKDSGTR